MASQFLACVWRNRPTVAVSRSPPFIQTFASQNELAANEFDEQYVIVLRAGRRRDGASTRSGNREGLRGVYEKGVGCVTRETVWEPGEYITMLALGSSQPSGMQNCAIESHPGASPCHLPAAEEVVNLPSVPQLNLVALPSDFGSSGMVGVPGRGQKQNAAGLAKKNYAICSCPNAVNSFTLFAEWSELPLHETVVASSNPTWRQSF